MNAKAVVKIVVGTDCPMSVVLPRIVKDAREGAFFPSIINPFDMGTSLPNL